MEQRKGKVNISTAGGTSSEGAKTYKVTLPNKWIKQMGLNNNPNIDLLFDGKAIYIESCVPATQYAKRKIECGHKVKKLTFYDGDKICTEIYADYTDKTIKIQNFGAPAVKCAFGNTVNPGWKDFEFFLKERCISKNRDGIREYLEVLGIDEYDPMAIIRKTKGRMAEDNQWIHIENLT